MANIEPIFPTFHSQRLAEGAIERITLSRNQVSARLGISMGAVDKLIATRLIAPRPTPADIDALNAMPYLKIATGELTVLRGSSRADAYDDDRPFIGYHPTMTDDELEAATLRWWRSDPERVQRNGLFALTIATFPAAVYQITGIQDRHERDGEDGARYHYEGRLLARRDPGGYSPFDRPVPGHLKDAVRTIMGSRIKVASGGPIGYLTAPVI